MRRHTNSHSVMCMTQFSEYHSLLVNIGEGVYMAESRIRDGLYVIINLIKRNDYLVSFHGLPITAFGYF